jgi:OPT oligopeptide transporter protein
MAKYLPTRTFKFLRYQFTFNPGPFNQKEHMLITTISNNTLSGTYTASLFVIQISPIFFNQAWAKNLTYQYFITISMQFLGYGLAGLARSALVYPDFCIWPSSLSVIVLNRSLHEKEGYSFRIFRLVLNRYRYFLLIFGLIIIWTM